MRSKALLFVFLIFTTSLASAEKTESPVQGDDLSSEKSYAVIFSKKTKNLNLKKAYNLQKQFVKNSVAKKGVVIVGFKAGLTTADGPAQFGLKEPLSGVLLVSPMRGHRAEISREKTTNIMLEQEIAFLINKKISSRVTPQNVLKYVGAIAPAIEIPEMNFQTKDFNGMDIIANNALAYKLMVGDWQPPLAMNKLDALKVVLTCDGKTLTEGQGSNASGSQLNALVWLINNIINQGYDIKEGQILITGNLIRMTPALPCDYTAKFGELGNLQLLVKP